jgi:uncharacterized cofD-like protein
MTKAPKRKKVVTITGGTGGFALLSGLKKYDFNISAIVSMMDNGGSTGILRKELKVLPPGDARQCLAALSNSSILTPELMNYRFKKGGHSFGNIFLSALEKTSRSFSVGLEKAAEAMQTNNIVIPSTEDDTQIYIKLKNGEILKGEDELDRNKKIKTIGVENIYLKPEAKACKKAIDKIKTADFIIIGPADFYAGIICNLLVSGIAPAIKNAKAKVIFICNLTNKKGQTENFNLNSYVEKINKHIGKDRIDHVVFNNKKPSLKLIKQYEKLEGKNTLVSFTDEKRKQSFKITQADLLENNIIKKNKADAISKTRSFIRHDSNKLAKAIVKILKLKT